MAIKILYVGANSDDTEYVRLDEELRDIKQEIASSDFRDQLTFRALTATRTTDLARALTDFNPDIVHFSGHGCSDGNYLLLDKDGFSTPIGPVQMASLFAAVGTEAKVALFNHCFSDAQAAAVGKHVQCCISTTGEIDDLTSNRLAIEFYRAIGAGKSVQASFNIARETIRMSDSDAAELFQLTVQTGIVPDKLVLINQPAGPTLELLWKPEPSDGSFHIVFGLQNKGTASVKGAALRLHSSANFSAGGVQKLYPYQDSGHSIQYGRYDESVLVRRTTPEILYTGGDDEMARYDTGWWYQQPFKDLTVDYEVLWDEGSRRGSLVITKSAFCKQGNIHESPVLQA